MKEIHPAAIVLTLAIIVPAWAQTSGQTARLTVKTGTPPRTADGHPDLGGLLDECHAYPTGTPGRIGQQGVLHRSRSQRHGQAAHSAGEQPGRKTDIHYRAT